MGARNPTDNYHRLPLEGGEKREREDRGWIELSSVGYPSPPPAALSQPVGALLLSVSSGVILSFPDPQHPEDRGSEVG